MSDKTSKIGILIIVIILAVTGVLIISKTRQQQTAVLTEPSDNPGETEIEDKELVASSSTLSSPIPAPVSLKEYVYPNSRELKSNSKGFVLESSDSAQLITDWYKNKINSLEFNARSFTQTNTNGEILNKISAAKPGENLEVTIKKDQTTSKVKITVDRS